MFYYTNVSRRGNTILFRGVKDGERITEQIKFKPKYYIEDNKNPSKFRSLYGHNVSEIKFDSMSEATDFRKRYDGVQNVSIFGMENYVIQFISEAFPYEVKFDPKQIKTAVIDIEVWSGDGFPESSVAEQQVTAITIKTNQSDEYLVWGLKEYDPSKNERNITYFQFNSEVEMLLSFVNWWAMPHNIPDVITGWNSKMFDMPYLINRITKLIGFDTAKKFSPWNVLQERSKINGIGQEENYYEILGISQLDYYDLFLKFGVLTYGRQESYKLDHIGAVIVGQQKVDYSEYETLHNLYLKNHQLFIDYNVVDVELIEKLEEAVNLLELAMTIAYKSKTNYSDAFGTTTVWDSVIYNELKKRNIVVPMKQNKTKKDIAGGYVKEPVLGLVENIVSFDYESLYPNIMVQYNISAETFVDTASKIDVTIPNSPARYRKDIEGIFPQVIKQFYGDRRTAKKQMLDAKNEYRDNPSKELKNKISVYNNQQMAIKILMNSLYGAVANKHFRYFDSMIAESVTLTGQRSIRFAEQIMNQEMNRILKTDNVDYVVAIDTDSIYVNMNPLVKKVNPEDPVDFLSKISEQHFKPMFDDALQKHADETNAYVNRLNLEREVIADRGIWTAKKRYFLSVHDNEGVRYSTPEMKVMGIEAVKSSTPQICRDKFQEIFKVILYEGEKATQEFVAEFFEEFKKLPPEIVGCPRSVSNVKKWRSGTSTYIKGTPINSKGSLIYNKLIQEYGLSNKYETIKDGDKIKYVYLVRRNPIKEAVIAFPGTLPKELKLHDYIDYNLMFEKTFLEPLRLILEPIGWKEKEESTLEDFFT